MRWKYLIIILITCALCITGCVRSTSNSNIKEYLSSGTPIDSNAKDIMPDLNDLPKYHDIAYKYTHKPLAIFSSDSVALIIKYDSKTYESEKDKLKEKYIFLAQKSDFNSNESKEIIPEYEFSINDYSFKVVAGNEKDNTEFPKSFGMIGTSDEKKSIAYLYFYDDDLDYITGSMADFIREYFEYDF